MNRTNKTNRAYNEFKKTYINGELAIKPYYYVRNKILHVRYTVDRAIVLSDTEDERVKEALSEGTPTDKQDILGRYWNFFEHNVQKPIINDALTAMFSKRGDNNDR